jgi:ribonuclease HI
LTLRAAATAYAPTLQHAIRRARIVRVSGRDEYLCYTDGSCKAGDAGGWGYCIKPPAGAPLEAYGKASGTLAKVMEYQAVAEALAALPDGVSAVVFSDNQSLVESLSKNLETWRERAFAKVDPLIVESARRIDAAITSKQLAVRWQWVRSHNGNAGNERADSLAAQGAREAKAELRGRR